MARQWTQLSAVVQQALGSGLSDFILNANPASGGYLTWPASEDGQVTYYFAQSVSGDQREVGSGIYTHATRTIQRTNIYQSTSGDTKVNFSQAPLVVATWGGELFRRVDEVLDITDGGTVQDALVALGLNNVDNTADADKPVSSATQTALDGKEPLISPKNTAFNKPFAGSGVTEGVARADHNHTGIYEPAGTVLTHSGGEDGAAAHVSASDRTTWDSAGTDSHTHANKALLDTYTQTNTDLAAAVVHKDAVDPHVTTSQKADWDSKAEGVHTHLLANITDSGSAAALDAGTAIGNVVTLADVGGNPGLPAVDGSQLTGITSGTFLHADLTDTTTDGHPGTVITIAAGVQGNAVSIAANGSLQDAGVPPGGATDLSITTRTGTAFTIASSTGQDAVAPAASITEAGLLSAADKTSIDGLGTAASLDVGTTVGDIVQLVDVGGTPGMPAVDGSQLTGLAGVTANNWLTANSGVNFTNPPSAAASNAIALGDGADASLASAIAIGNGAVAQTDTRIVIGEYSGEAGTAIVLRTINGALRVLTNGEVETSSDGGTNWISLSADFIGLTDTPASYASQQGKLIKVNATEDGLIFGDPSGTTVSWGDISGTLSTQTDLQAELDAKQNIVDVVDVKNWLMCYGGADFATAPVATDTGTIALGDAANVGGNSHAIAIGTSATATAGSCVTIGRSSTVSGAAGVAIGWSASVGDYAVAVGSDTTATSGNGSVALGYQCTTGTDTRIAVGLTAQAEAGTSILVRTAVGALRVLTDGTVESSSNGGGSWAAVGGGGSTLHADLTDTATDGHPGSAITIGGGVQGNAVAIGASGELVDAGTAPGGTATAIVSDVALDPTSYADGAKWFYPDKGNEYVKYTDSNGDELWMQSAAGCGSGILPGDDNEVSPIRMSVVATLPGTPDPNTLYFVTT